jgi:hypothetical protein
MEGAKILLVSVSITAMVFFWAKFSVDDQLANTVNVDNAPPVQESLMVNLSALPTLVPVEGREEEEENENPSDQPLELRSVSAPAPQTAPANGPVVVVGGKGGGGGGTTTGSS